MHQKHVGYEASKGAIEVVDDPGKRGEYGRVLQVALKAQCPHFVVIYALTQELPDRTLRFEQDVELTSDREYFRLRFDRRALVNGTLAHRKTWDERIPRDFQ